MKNKIIIIACYFGKLPNYFEFWQNSCLKNKSIDFIFFTDQEIKITEQNFKVINIEFKQLIELIKNKIGYVPSKMTPYKLCDFKPAYGKIFEEYTIKYDFWGYCDIDLIFGNISKYVNDEILNNNDVILNLGHLTIYKNDIKHKNLFKLPGSNYDYRVVFSSNENFAFDEMSGMHKIFKANQIAPYMEIPVADIDKKYSRYKLYDRKNFRNQIFVYDNAIYRYYLDKNNICKDEYIYLHFQKKKINITTKDFNKYIIAKEGFVDFEKIDIDILKYNLYDGKIYEDIEFVKYIFFKIIQFWKSNSKEKIIWIKQKIKK